MSVFSKKNEYQNTISFKKNFSEEKRINESSRILVKYPDRIPIIVETQDADFKLDKKKYLVPHDITVSQFIYVIRKRVKINSEKALFLFINNTLPPSASLIGHVYKENKDPDGFLYIVATSENTFG